MKRTTRVLVACVMMAATVNFAKAETLYGISNGTNSIYSIDQSNGMATLVTSVDGDVALTGASFLAGSLYATDIITSGNYNFGTVDLTTGSFTILNNQDGSTQWYGLASDENAGLLYSIDVNDSNILKSITPDGTVTSIGTGTGITGGGMAYDDANDILYATGADNLYTVNTGTGTASLIGGMGIYVNGSVIGLAYNESDNILYANTGSNLYTVNVSTGAATIVGPNNVANIDGLAWLGDDFTVPEPSTFAGLLGIVSVSLLGYGWRRKRQQAA